MPPSNNYEKEDNAEVERWAATGHDRRATRKSRSRQRYPSEKYSENYRTIDWRVDVISPAPDARESS